MRAVPPDCDILMCVVPSRQALLSCSTTSPGPLRLSRSLATRWARDVAAQPFEFLALMRTTAYPVMQAEAVRIGAQGHRYCVPAGHGAQVQYLQSGARPQRNSLGARGTMDTELSVAHAYRAADNRPLPGTRSSALAELPLDRE